MSYWLAGVCDCCAVLCKSTYIWQAPKTLNMHERHTLLMSPRHTHTTASTSQSWIRSVWYYISCAERYKQIDVCGSVCLYRHVQHYVCASYRHKGSIGYYKDIHPSIPASESSIYKMTHTHRRPNDFRPSVPPSLCKRCVELLGAEKIVVCFTRRPGTSSTVCFIPKKGIIRRLFLSLLHTHNIGAIFKKKHERK